MAEPGKSVDSVAYGGRTGMLGGGLGEEGEMGDDIEPDVPQPKQDSIAGPGWGTTPPQTPGPAPQPGWQGEHPAYPGQWPPPPPPASSVPPGGPALGAGPPAPGAPQAPIGPPPGTPPWGYTPQPYAMPRQRGRGLAIAAIVMSSIALLAVLLMVIVAFAVPYTGTATGKVTSVGAGGGLDGGSLEQAVRSAMSSNGGEVTSIDCPDTAKVDQGVVSVCHGTMDGSDGPLVVFFESPSGDFTVTAL